MYSSQSSRSALSFIQVLDPELYTYMDVETTKRRQVASARLAARGPSIIIPYGN